MTTGQIMPIFDLQFVFFFANPSLIVQYDAFSANLREKLKDSFSELNPTFFSMSVDAPLNFPRYQITSQDEKFKFRMTAERCDLSLSLWNHNKYDQDFFQKVVINVITAFKDHSLDFTRIGYLTKYVIDHDTPEKAIASNFLKIPSSADNEIYEPSIRFTFQKNLNDWLSCNDVYRLEAAEYRDFSTGKKKNSVVIIHDYNTSISNSNNIELENAQKFISSLSDATVKSYIELLKS